MDDSLTKQELQAKINKLEFQRRYLTRELDAITDSLDHVPFPLCKIDTSSKLSYLNIRCKILFGLNSSSSTSASSILSSHSSTRSWGGEWRARSVTDFLSPWTRQNFLIEAIPAAVQRGFWKGTISVKPLQGPEQIAVITLKRDTEGSANTCQITCIFHKLAVLEEQFKLVNELIQVFPQPMALWKREEAGKDRPRVYRLEATNALAQNAIGSKLFRPGESLESFARTGGSQQDPLTNMDSLANAGRFFDEVFRSARAICFPNFQVNGRVFDVTAFLLLGDTLITLFHSASTRVEKEEEKVVSTEEVSLQHILPSTTDITMTDEENLFGQDYKEEEGGDVIEVGMSDGLEMGTEERPSKLQKRDISDIVEEKAKLQKLFNIETWEGIGVTILTKEKEDYYRLAYGNRGFFDLISDEEPDIKSRYSEGNFLDRFNTEGRTSDSYVKLRQALAQASRGFYPPVSLELEISSKKKVFLINTFVFGLSSENQTSSSSKKKNGVCNNNNNEEDGEDDIITEFFLVHTRRIDRAAHAICHQDVHYSDGIPFSAYFLVFEWLQIPIVIWGRANDDIDPLSDTFHVVVANQAASRLLSTSLAGCDKKLYIPGTPLSHLIPYHEPIRKVFAEVLSDAVTRNVRIPVPSRPPLRNDSWAISFLGSGLVMAVAKEGVTHLHGLNKVRNSFEEERRYLSSARPIARAFTRLFYFLPIGIAVLHEDGTVILVNDKLCNIVGCQEDLMIGKSIGVFIAGEEIDIILSAISAVSSGLLKSYQFKLGFLKSTLKLDCWVALNLLDPEDKHVSLTVISVSGLQQALSTLTIN